MLRAEDVKTVADVEEIAAVIDRIAADSEAAHGEEDDLYKAVLRLIAAGHPDSQALAAAAVTVSDLDFPRWYS